MKKASVWFIVGFFLILVWSAGAQTTPPVGYFKHGDFFCSSDPNFEKPDSAGSRKFCQPQATNCQAVGGNFCTAGTRNFCCPADNICGKGTALTFWEVAVCVPPTPAGKTCAATSPGYAGRTKEGKNICCQANEEPGPSGKGGGTNAPYCQPKSRSVCALGERFVQGTGDKLGEKRCCASGTIPAHHPNGLPFCARLPSDITRPTIVLTVPDKYLKIEDKHLWLTNPQATLYAYDASGLASASISALAPGSAVPLVKNCVANQTSTFCTLIVPKNKWVLGTMIFITAKDQSPNGNVSFEGYKLVSSGQLQKQDTSGSKIIIPSAPTIACHTFNTNLSIGMSGSEVTALQKVLTRAGFPVSENGSFGESTASAVSSFQLKYRSELLTANGLNYPTGYFGPATRQKMNQLFGCG